MTAWSNNFNAIASGTAITTSNSGTSGTAFGLVQTGTGTSVTSQATSAFEGATGMQIVTAASVAADVVWSISGAGTGVRLSQSFWFKAGAALPASELPIVNNSSGAVRMSTTGQVLVYSATSALLATATAAAAGTWLFIQHATTPAASTTTGRAECQVTTAAGTTLLTYDSGTTVNANTAAVTSHTYGALSSPTTPAGTWSFDLLNVSNVLTSGFPGNTAPIPTYAPGQFLVFF